MINLQSEFLSFHSTIKLDDENAVLRDKRDILLNKLKEKITSDAPTYTTFNQGSYAMNTGTIPDDGDYDIDVGLKFEMSKADYPDPITPKKWVRDALLGHTKSVVIKRSCVTVTYQKNGEPAYHVDFAVYSSNNSDNRMYIAKGKEFSETSKAFWELSDPQLLISMINEKYQNDDRSQFKRVIRYLKKWKNNKFDISGSSAPTGIALTVLAYYYFSVRSVFDNVSMKSIYDDHSALISFVEAIKNTFLYVYDVDTSAWYHTISVKLPVDPRNDLFEKMTKSQMESFYNKLDNLLSALKEAKNKEKRSEACRILVDQFGEKFPVTYDKSTVGTSESATTSI